MERDAETGKCPKNQRFNCHCTLTIPVLRNNINTIICPSGNNSIYQIPIQSPSTTTILISKCISLVSFPNFQPSLSSSRQRPLSKFVSSTVPPAVAHQLPTALTNTGPTFLPPLVSPTTAPVVLLPSSSVSLAEPRAKPTATTPAVAHTSPRVVAPATIVSSLAASRTVRTGFGCPASWSDHSRRTRSQPSADSTTPPLMGPSAVFPARRKISRKFRRFTPREILLLWLRIRMVSSS